MGISFENPPVVNGLAQLYKFEPFLYQYTTLVPGDTIQVTPTPEIVPFTTVTSNTVTFGSSNGYGNTYVTPLFFSVQVLSNTTIVDSRTFNVVVGPGRFFPPASNTVYTFYRNEPVPVTYGAPIDFDTSASMTQVFSSPSLPVGLTLTQGDACGNKFLLNGTPGVQIPPANYQIIGRNTTNGRVVTTTVNIAVNAERILVNLSGSSNITGMTVGTPIVDRVVTSIYPTFYGPTQFRYQWNNNPPDGLFFADQCGNQIPFFPPSYQPTDASSTIVIRGTPTLTAANMIAATGGNSTSINLTALVFNGPSNTIPFTFSFGETVLFTNSNAVPTTPTVRTLYQGEDLSGADDIRFHAKTFFTSNVGISNIFSPDLRADLSLAYSGSQALLFTPANVVDVSTGTFTLRAVNSNGVTRDVSLSITSLPDVVTFDAETPLNGISYEFIVSRPLANAKTGFYPSPIRFKASAEAQASLSDISYSVAGINGVGLITSLDASTNVLTLTGTPTTPIGSTPLVVSATNTQTGANASRTVNYSITPDVFTFAFNPDASSYMFLQNEPITPIRVTATTLSERAVLSYSSTNLPAGLVVTPFGVIQGTPTTSVFGNYTIVANTGYQTATSAPKSYGVLPDFILFTTPEIRYNISPGGAVPAIEFDAVTRSGLNVSNFLIDLSASGNPPTQFGVTMNSNGMFGGTMTTSLPPDPIIPTVQIPFFVTAQAPNITGNTEFYIGTDNPYALRSYAIEYSSNAFGIYYTDVVLSNTDVPNYILDQDYGSWTGINTSNTPNTWCSDIAYRTTTSSNGFTSNITIMVAANDICTGYLLRSTDGISFTTPTLPTGTVITSLLYSSNQSKWYGAGIENLNPDAVFLFESSNDGVTWSNAGQVAGGTRVLTTRTGSNSVFETYGTRIIEEFSTFLNSNVLSIVGGSNFSTPGFTTRAETLNYGTTWDTSYAMLAEGNGSLFDGNYRIVYGSDYYLTTNGNTDDFIGSTTTMKAFNMNTNSLDGVVSEFNVVCYDVKKFTNFGLALGVHYYTGLGYRQEIRYSTTTLGGTILRGPWVFLDLQYEGNSVFPYSATRPIPTLKLGPIFSDGVSVHVTVITPSLQRGIYSHLLSDPDPSTGWTFKTSKSTSFFDANFNSILPPVRISTGDIQPYIDFVVRDSVTGDPFPTPVFTSPTNREYNFYQYVQIEPIQIAAVTGGLFGGPITLFILDADLPAGLQFNPITGIISGRPFEAFQRRQLPVYAYDGSFGSYTRIVLTVSSLVPRVVKHQTSAGAYTSLVRQYTEVNAAQNARDNRVYPAAERALGEFMSPPAPDVVTQTVNPQCFDPKSCGPAPTS